MRPKIFDFDPVDVDADGISEAQTPAWAGNLDIDGALTSGGVAVLDYARQLVITSDGNDSGVTFTVTGTDADGHAQTEAITGPNATTAESTKYFKTITQIAISGAGTGNITVGTVDELVSQSIPIDHYSDLNCAITLDITGTINYSVQESKSDIQSLSSATQSAVWYDITAFSGKTADVVSTANQGARAIRFLVNSYSSGAEAQMYISQPTR